MSNEQQNPCDKARLKSWEGGEHVAVNNVRETACDTAHWGWVRGFNEGFDAGAASVSRKEVEWVAVEDRLPIKYGRYLVTRHRRADGARLVREAFYDDDDKTFSHTHASGSVLDDVIAWCEKPKPYTPKEATNE